MKGQEADQWQKLGEEKQELGRSRSNLENTSVLSYTMSQNPKRTKNLTYFCDVMTAPAIVQKL